jgi:hypothetical protein
MAVFGCNIDVMFGQYEAWYWPPNSNEILNMGVTEGQYVLTFGSESVPIGNTNKFGSSELDGIYLGGNCAVAIVFKEWNATVAATVWPYGIGVGRTAYPGGRDGITGQGASGIVGQSECAMAGQLRLVPLAGPAAYRVPNTRGTFSALKAGYMPNHTLDAVIGLGERVFAHVFKLWPTQVAVPTTNNRIAELRWFEWQNNTGS